MSYRLLCWVNGYTPAIPTNYLHDAEGVPMAFASVEDAAAADDGDYDHAIVVEIKE